MALGYWLRIIAAECGMTAKKFIECIRIAHPNDPLSSTLRVQITNYFYSQSSSAAAQPAWLITMQASCRPLP